MGRTGPLTRSQRPWHPAAATKEMGMELKWLEDALSLSATLSFSRAACERNITQSALSRRIRQLESWLGLDTPFNGDTSK